MAYQHWSRYSTGTVFGLGHGRPPGIASLQHFWPVDPPFPPSSVRGSPPCPAPRPEKCKAKAKGPEATNQVSNKISHYK